MNDTGGLNMDFYVVAHEAGAEHPALPTWACRKINPAGLQQEIDNQVSIKPVDSVPGAFQLLDVLSVDECDRLIEISEALGYLPDAAVSLPRNIRHNDSLVWVVDEATDGAIWSRIEPLLAQLFDGEVGKPAVGLNARFRFYRYAKQDFFKPHTDGAWPGSRVINGTLVSNAFPDRYSQMSFLIFLNDDFDGGATRFMVDAEDASRPARRGGLANEADVRTPAGGVLCFPHGMHPQHCVHSSEPILSGCKYIIRTDLLFLL